MFRDLFQKVGSWLSVVMDLILINLLWLACCIPVVTIGASTTAIHYVMRKMAMGDSYQIWADFWKSFRQNWKQGTILELILVLAAAIGVADIVIGCQTEGMLGMVILIAGIVITVLVLAVMTLAFPLLARYTQTIPNLLKNALILSVCYFWIAPVGCVTAVIFPALALWNEGFANLAIPIWMLVGGSLTALVVQLLMRPVYRRLETPETEKE